MDRERRNFLKRLSLILASIAGFFAFLSLLKFAIPGLYRANNRVKIGKPGSFPLNDYTYISEHKLYVYRDHTGVKVVSAICTHLGCVIEKTDEGFQCPCHGSCFDERGKVLSGAASKDLPWYRLYEEADGQVVVDLKKTVDSKYLLETNWNMKGSRVRGFEGLWINKILEDYHLILLLILITTKTLC